MILNCLLDENAKSLIHGGTGTEIYLAIFYLNYY